MGGILRGGGMPLGKKNGVEEKRVREWHYIWVLASTQNETSSKRGNQFKNEKSLFKLIFIYSKSKKGKSV